MNRERFLTQLQVEVTTLEVWLEQRWLLPERNAETESFSDTDLARGRLIRDLTGNLGVNHEGVDVILHLLDQIHGLRRAMGEMREGMGQARR